MSNRAKGWIIALSFSLGFYAVTVGAVALVLFGWVTH
jgi:hypothetical protein